jgi:hypothetical protein
MKIANKTFYKRHSIELERFLVKENSLHIINENSKNKIVDDISHKVYFNPENLDYKQIEFSKKYDTIIFTDIIESGTDIYNLLQLAKENLSISGKLIITSLNTKYIYLSNLLESLNLKNKNIKQSYVATKKISNIASGVGFEYINTISKQIIPFRLFGLGTILNIILELISFRFMLGVRTYTIFRNIESKKIEKSKSIIIPAKNEEGNLPQLVKRIPKFDNCEIIIVCGDSTDNTLITSENIKKEYHDFNITVLEQSGIGKANAVWEALRETTGEVIAILDADISVEPETLEQFFEIIDNNYADFVNGSRLIYQMEADAMRRINKFGNRLFQFLISQVTRTHLTDSLCGTKVFKRELIEKIFWWQETFGLKDPFGDFDLIFSASFTGQKISEYPINYKARIYGKTQISRFRDGLKLIRYFLKSFIVFNSSRSKN